jgi:CheY-like chemotaxis protein
MLEPQERARETAPATTALQGKSLLIVEGNATNAALLTRLAERHGLVPTTMTDAVQAISWLKQGNAPDLAIIDSSLPEMSAEALAESIHRLCAASPPTLVLLTSFSLASERRDHELQPFARLQAHQARPGAHRAPARSQWRQGGARNQDAVHKPVRFVPQPPGAAAHPAGR